MTLFCISEFLQFKLQQFHLLRCALSLRLLSMFSHSLIIMFELISF
jgi:hypothetical protein